MILQSLVRYYDRLLAEGAVQPPGFQNKEIPWVVEIDKEGRFIRLIPTGGDDKRGRSFIVPHEVKKSVNIAANLLWDNPEYVFGAARPGLNEAQAAKVPKRHAAFLQRLNDLPEAVRNDEGVSAALYFLERRDWGQLQATEGWVEMTASGTNVSFRLAGENDLICGRAAVRRHVESEAKKPAAGTAWCLVSGERVAPAILHPAIKGVRGAQTSGANLISFNLDAFRSHGWSQGENAPVGERAAHAYVAALNFLLHRDNPRHHHVEGDTTFVFWAASSHAFEDEFPRLLGDFGDHPTEDDGSAVKDVLESVRKGIRPHLDDPTPFHVLALAPNAARLSVRFWYQGPVGEMARRILDHFDDLAMVGLEHDRQAARAWRLVSAVAMKGKLSALQEQFRGRLFGEILAAVLGGRPYPETLLARAVERCRTEQAVWPIRAALIKAVLCRRARFSDSIEKEVTVSLDRENRTLGYRLGRLFAVLEGVQRAANPGINTTIRDRFFGAATSTPRAVFTELMRLKDAHLRKLRRGKPPLAVHFEKVLDEIMGGFDGDTAFPAHLGLEDQGRFIVGYHHQRHSVAKAVPEADATDLDSANTDATEK
jgi:CRISPR-associated protein Csd1